MDKCQSAVSALTFLPCPGRHPSLTLSTPCTLLLLNHTSLHFGDTGVSALQPTPLTFDLFVGGLPKQRTIFHVAKLCHKLY